MGALSKVSRTLELMKLQPVSRAVMRENLTYLPVEKLRRIEKAASLTKTVPGAVIEFGVALGGSGIILASLAGPGRRYIGLDVFGMIPPPTSEKDDTKSKERYETIRSGKSRGIGGDEYYGYKRDLYSEVEATFKRHGFTPGGDAIQLVQGLFEETWPSIQADEISLVHIDCDWYDPVLYCLHAVADKLSIGAIIIIDDYYDYGGCRTAVDEFLAARTDFVMEDGKNPFLRRI